MDSLDTLPTPLTGLAESIAAFNGSLGRATLAMERGIRGTMRLGGPDDIGRDQLGALEEQERARRRLVDWAREQADHEDRIVQATSGVAQAYRDTGEAIAGTFNQSQRVARQQDPLVQPFRHAGQAIQKTLTDAFENAFSGSEKRSVDFAGKFRKTMMRSAAEIASSLVFQPIMGGVAGAFGFGGGGGGGRGGGTGGGASGMTTGGRTGSGGGGSLLNIGSLLSAGQSTSLYDMGASFATSGFGESLGLSNSLGEITSLGGNIAAGLSYSPWGALGSFGANALSLGASNPYINMAGGALGSIAGATVATSAVSGGALGTMLGSWAGPLGAVAGGFLGTSLSGLFGPGASVGPNANAHVVWVSDKVVYSGSAADNG
ncbi:MAG: hypothetical protein K2Q10_10915, partial [Rhodospirillales bacterium]|nr:hypothetical protein [Rhodospirillales bacterium]